MSEDRAKLTSGARGDLPDSAFAYIESGKAVNGKTPDKYRHFPIHDAAHVRNALARIAQGARFGAQAKGKVMAAAKKFNIQHDEAASGRSLESLFPEVRFMADKPELRYAEGDTEQRHITGYASMFTKVSRRLGGFHEKVLPGAFDDALRAVAVGETNVVCRYNHKDDMVLGTTHADTLKLSVDERGLNYDVIPPNCRADVMELVERGDVRYSSFAFRVMNPGEDDTWSESEYGLPMRSLHKVQLADVAPVLDPAYFDTTAAARSISGAVESLAAWVDGDPAEVRSMLESGRASKFFRRTDRPSTPAVTPAAAAQREESRVLDDPAVSLRSQHVAEEPVEVREGQWEVETDDRYVRNEDEIRAAVKPRDTSALCMRYHHGEPCVRPSGHPADGPNAANGGHVGLCWGRNDGLPCNQHEGHDGDHTPMTVASRSAEEGAEGTEEQRDNPETAPEAKTLSGPEAMAKMMARRKDLTQLPE